MREPLCIYHAGCQDGQAAAWVVWKYFKGYVELEPMQYGDSAPLEEKLRGRNVVFVDFSLPHDAIIRMAEYTATILILDHHVTAQKELEGFPVPGGPYDPERWFDEEPFGCIRCLFDMKRSGASMAWDYFFGGRRPRLINLVEDRDLWRFKFDPYTRSIHSYLTLQTFDPEQWQSLASRLESEVGLETAKAQGAAINQYIMQQIDYVLRKNVRYVKIAGCSVPFVNMYYGWASEAGNLLAKGHQFAATYYDTDKERIVSLRSDGDSLMSFDVSQIAKSYGGGGHKHAAGFKVPLGWEGDK